MLSNATTFRRIVAGLCLILAPLFLLISNLLQTRTPITTENLLDSITANAVANEISFAFALYGFTLMVPAVIGIIHLLRHRSVALGHIGGTFLILGMVSFAFVAGTEAILFIAGADPTMDREALIAINDRIGTSVVYNLINLTEVFGYLFGTLILAIAIFRAKLVPRVIAIFLASGILARFTLASFYAGIIISDALYCLAFAFLGVSVLRQSDEEWERPPERAATPREKAIVQGT
jgi:hypothetical protein